MGLSITVLKNPVQTRKGFPKSDEDFDGQYVYPNRDFTSVADGIEPGIYDGETHRFHPGPYSSYNHFRNLLSQVGMGDVDSVIWENPGAYSNRPFFEQVNFSDCEGVIGPRTSKKLAKDYEDNREKFVKFVQWKYAHDIGERDYLIDRYDRWAEGFKIAAENNGMVLFH